MVVGTVVGIGIFKAPSVAAAHTAGEGAFLALWLLGGLITLVGALCYSELGATYPSVGGEFHFLRKAYGREVGFMFAWGRMTVMQSGSIAAAAFVYGDYASSLLPAGAHGAAVHAALAILGLSALQLSSTEKTSQAQLALTVATVALVLLIAAIGLAAPPKAAPQSAATSSPAAGLAMVFILLTYGGWSEAAYLSGEVRNPQRDIPCALLVGIVLVTALYLFVNYAYLRALGFEGVKRSEVVAADVVALVLGERGAGAIAAAVCIASLSTLNATILTGARSIYALGRSFAPLAMLGRSDAGGHAPRNAILLQAAITLGLVLLGAFTRNGFESMVEYTAPVFWLFMLLVGVSLFGFRWRDANRAAAFRVPLYPFTPALFCATSAYLIYSSLVYTGRGALIGMSIFAIGIPIYRLGRRTQSPADPTRCGEQKE